MTRRLLPPSEGLAIERVKAKERASEGEPASLWCRMIRGTERRARGFSILERTVLRRC